ncbi:hypothetical protein EQH57_0314 [Dictyocoela roeselum]|nr:hypothetical protein EQH57_0314 [Dictyocoela roeselum]
MTAYKYQAKLYALWQEDFITIRAYLNQIERNVNKLAICLNWSENIKVEKTQEIFYCGLNETIKFELTKLVSRDYKTILTTLIEMECFIIDKIHREYQSSHNDPKTKVYDHGIHHHSKNTNNKPSMYCKFHNSRTHNTQECRRYNKGKNLKENIEKDQKPDSRSYAINEPKPQPRAIEIPLSINENEYKALVDTGSIENYLPEKIINRQNIPTARMNPTKMTEIADSSLVEIDSYSEVNFKIFNDKNNIYKSKFYVIPNPNG